MRPRWKNIFELTESSSSCFQLFRFSLLVEFIDTWYLHCIPRTYLLCYDVKTNVKTEHKLWKVWRYSFYIISPTFSRRFHVLGEKNREGWSMFYEKWKINFLFYWQRDVGPSLLVIFQVGIKNSPRNRLEFVRKLQIEAKFSIRQWWR